MLTKHSNKCFSSLVSTPLLIEKIKPDNWDLWWNLWGKHSHNLNKIKETANGKVGYKGYNSGIEIWQGLDLYVKNEHNTPWECPYINGETYFPEMFRVIKRIPVDIQRVRVVKNNTSFPLHKDLNPLTSWQLRCLFHCTSEKSLYFYGLDKDNYKDVYYQDLPDSTNCFVYNNDHVYHGTRYKKEHQKYLLQIWYKPTQEFLDLIKESSLFYSQYVWYI